MFNRANFSSNDGQRPSDNKTARESTDTAKAKDVCAHNFHSYKNDNTPFAVLLAIEIFPVPQIFLALLDQGRSRSERPSFVQIAPDPCHLSLSRLEQAPANLNGEPFARRGVGWLEPAGH